MPKTDPDALSQMPDGQPYADQPRWRQDFPVDVPQDTYISRREFAKFLVLTSAAFTTGQFWILWENWRRQQEPAAPVLKIAELAQIPVGGSLVFHYPTPDEPCLLIRPDANTLRAYSQKCTHLSCAVVPEVERNLLACPCHHGYFSLATGEVLEGPPQRPLPQIVLEVRETAVYAVGVELRT